MKSDDKIKVRVINIRKQVAEAIKNGIIQDNRSGCSEASDIVANVLSSIHQPEPMRPKYRELADQGGLVSLECPQCQEFFGLSIKFLDEHSEVLMHFTCPYCQFEGSIDER